MRCNPTRWLWGILPVAVWAWITVLGEHARIEADLKERAEGALRAAGSGWALTGFDGRDGLLTGRAEDDAEPPKAVEIARKVWGVRVVEGRTELIEKIENYMWSAALTDGRIRLSGYVPNEDMRKQVVALVGQSLPKLPADDQMRLGRGAPPKEVWLSGIGFGLKQLASLKRGTVELNNTALSVSGEAGDFPSYKGVKKALQSLPKGVKLVSEKVTPPVVSPFTWAAKLGAGQLALSGYVPSEKLREDIFAQVKKSFPKLAIVDRMEIADGAPGAWAATAAASLAGLALLTEGSAEISGERAKLSGEAGDEQAANAARAAFRKDPGRGMTLTDAITFKKPAVAVLSPYVTTVAATPAAVTLSGAVPSEAARSATIEDVKARLPGRAIEDRMTVADGAPEGWQTCLGAGLSGIGRLGAGKVAMTDKQLAVSGQSDDETLAKSIAGDVRAGAGKACDANVDIAVATGPEPYLTWRAVLMPGSDVVLEGDVPDAAARAELMRSAGSLFPGVRIVDRMTVASGRSARWLKVADLGLKSLARLRRGEAVLSAQQLTVRGEAADAVIAAGIKEQLSRDVATGYSGRDAIEVRSDAMIWAEAEAKRKAEADLAAAEAKRKADAQKAAEEAEAKRKADAVAAAKQKAAQASAAEQEARKKEAQKCQDLLRSAAAEGVIAFGRASADLDGKSLPTLNQLARIANACPSFKIEIEGHTDAEGTDERNQRLSDRRAKSVADYLVAQGVAADRLTSVGYGSKRPVAPNDTAENRAKNRRIEFGVLAN